MEPAIIQAASISVDTSTMSFAYLKEESQGVEIPCTGLIDVPPQNRILVSVPATGFVRKIVPIPGERVKKGSLIAELEHPNFLDLQRSYFQAKSDMQFVGKEYARQQQLVQDSISTRREFDEITARYTALRSQMALDSAELSMYGIRVQDITAQQVSARIRVYAPASGYVVAVNTHIGQMVTPDSGLIEIIDKSHLHLELDIFEQDIPHVSGEQEVRFRIQGEVSDRKARVYLLGQQVDPEMRTLRIHAHPEGSTAALRPGAFVEAVIIGDAAARWSGPLSALWQEGEDFFVWVLDGKQLQKTPLTGVEKSGDTFFLPNAPVWVDRPFLSLAPTR